MFVPKIDFVNIEALRAYLKIMSILLLLKLRLLY